MQAADHMGAADLSRIEAAHSSYGVADLSRM